MVATREYQIGFLDGWRICSSLMVMILRGEEWQALNFRLKDGDAERNQLSSKHIWRRTLSSIFGFIKRVVFEIVLTFFPLNYVTQPPLIAKTGGVSKPRRLASLVPSIWKFSPKVLCQCYSLTCQRVQWCVVQSLYHHVSVWWMQVKLKLQVLEGQPWN